MKTCKLVRDKIPELFKNKTDEKTYWIANEAQYYPLLKKKLIEEVNEFLADDSIEELADVMEVITAICASKKISRSQLEKERLKKRKTRGGFTKRIVWG